MLSLTVLALAQLPVTWDFNPKPDSFSSSALVDLRSLNEKVAGESGYIKVSSDGDFLRGDGKPIRFWAVNSFTAKDKPFVARPRWSQKEPDLDVHARFLAKRGVNLVRFHAQIAPSDKQAISDVNRNDIDWIWRSFASMKKQGIYSVVSPYWMVPTKIPKSWGIPGGEQSAAGLLFFDPTLQNAYKGWLKKLLLEKNPYTGVPLAKDPALAVFQIQNEDSLLFWTVNNIQGAQRDNLRALYTKWLLSKYGSHAAIQKAWQNNRTEGDTSTNYNFYNIWEMTQQRTGGMSVRLTDQTEFWSRTMYNWNVEVKRFLRDELGCKALVNAGNWKTADTVRLTDAERWSYTACDVDAVNHYVGGIHKGPNEGWSIDRGDRYTSISCVKNPEQLPVNIRQTKGRPMMVTESMLVMPNAFGAEAPFLVSAMSALNGLDAYFWFATGDEQWTPPQSANGYNDGQMKWMFGSPDVLGTFPAAAYMYRMGYINKGQPALIESRKPSEVFARWTPLIAETPSFDPNRDAGDIAPNSSIRTGMTPDIFLKGPVLVAYEETGKSVVNNVPVGPVMFDTQRRLCRINTPEAKGITFHNRTELETNFGGLKVKSRNTFGSLLAVSMDGKPLETSRKVLVQYATQARPAGWSEKPTQITLENKQVVSGFEIVNVGSAPWRLEAPILTIGLTNSELKKATALDENMMPVGNVAIKKVGNVVEFSFPKQGLYVVLE